VGVGADVEDGEHEMLGHLRERSRGRTNARRAVPAAGEGRVEELDDHVPDGDRGGSVRRAPRMPLDGRPDRVAPSDDRTCRDVVCVHDDCFSPAGSMESMSFKIASSALVLSSSGTNPAPRSIFDAESFAQKTRTGPGFFSRDAPSNWKRVTESLPTF